MTRKRQQSKYFDQLSELHIYSQSVLRAKVCTTIIRTFCAIRAESLLFSQAKRYRPFCRQLRCFCGRIRGIRGQFASILVPCKNPPKMIYCQRQCPPVVEEFDGYASFFWTATYWWPSSFLRRFSRQIDNTSPTTAQRADTMAATGADAKSVLMGFFTSLQK